MDYITIIKSKLLLSDIISKKVNLVKRGDNFIGLCPFHHEKTPSFSVNNSKGLYYCFGCASRGDIFEFVSQIEGISFRESIEKLSSIAGVELPKNGDQKKYGNLLTSLGLAANWFSDKLHKEQDAMSYLKTRNISLKTIDRFKIGYAPRSGLKSFLNASNIDDKTLISSGLINKNLHDYFYDRLMFPIYSITGKVVAFGGRVLHLKQQSKYLNSPENFYFKKKDSLYGINLAMSEIRKTQQVFVVEGYMDVIALHQAEIKNVVAPLGTAVSIEQIKSLWKLSNEVCICMDGDSAGYNASIRIAEATLSILEPGYTLKFVTLPDNKDPYDVCNEHQYNKESILGALEHLTKLHSEYLWHHALSSTIKCYDKLVPERYSTIEHKFTQYIHAIQNFSIKKYYKNYLFSQLNKLRSDSTSYMYKQKHITNKAEYFYDKSPEIIEVEQNQNIILRIAIEFPELLNSPLVFEQFSAIEIEDCNMRKVQQHIVDIVNSITSLSKETLLNMLANLKIESSISGIFEKTHVLNSQLTNRKSVDSILDNIFLIEELRSLQKEKTLARINGSLNLEEVLTMQIHSIEDKIQQMQMKFIQEKMNA